MVVAVAPIEKPSDETSHIGNSDTERGFVVGGGKYIGESNMCNITDHPDISFGGDCRESKGDDFIVDRKNSFSSAASGTADTSVEEFKDSSTVAEEKWHDADTVIPSSLGDRQLLSGEQNCVDDQGPVYSKNPNFEGDPCSSEICDVSGHYVKKPVSVTGLEKESALESDTRQSAGSELSECQTPECSEREILFQNGEMKQKSVIDVSTSGMFGGCSSSASLACNVCHCTSAKEGNALDNQESTDTQKLNSHMDEGDRPLKEFKAVGKENGNCWQELHDKKVEQGSESSKRLKVENLYTLSECDQLEEKDRVSPFQSNNSCDNDHLLGILLCDNAGSAAAREHIPQMSEMMLASISMNDKDQIGQKQEDYFESVSSNSCCQSNTKESNDNNLQDTGPSELCALCYHSSTVLESPLDQEPSELKSSVPVSCLSSLPHEGRGIFSQENLSAEGMQTTSNLHFNRNDDKVTMISARKKDEDREATPLEMGKNALEQENTDLLSMELRELKGDSREPDREIVVGNAEISDSNDLPVHIYESLSKEAEDVAHNSIERTTDTCKIEQEGMILAASNLGITSTSSSEDEAAFEIAEFFDNAGVVNEQRCALGQSAKEKCINESSNSLRILLSSDDILAFDRIEKPGFLNDRVRKDREAIEHPHRIAPSMETGRSVNHFSQDESHVFPEKWYEDAEDNEFTSAAFSGPIAYSGTVSYSGPIPYSGSVSYRSDSSTSTRSFAFPILASDWNSSPVKMAQPDSRFFKRRKRWRFFPCFCCKRSSTLYD